MKNLFLSLVVLMVTTMSFAQNTLVATLSHGDNVKMFYGSSALVNAVDAAESGDVITLSGGTFLSTKITKGITIRGNGATGTKPTIIGYNYNNTSIGIPQEDEKPFIMEGVKVNFFSGASYYPLYISGRSSNLYFLKCIISVSNIEFSSGLAGEAKFVNCSLGSFTHTGASTVKFTNCHVGGYTNGTTSSSKAEFFNCVLLGDPRATHQSSFINSIISYNNPSGSIIIPSTVSAMNSVFINCSLSNVVQRVDCTVLNLSDTQKIFETCNESKNQYGNIWYTPTSPYELTEEAKTTYLGTDGKEVGSYGGQYPYDLTPTYPRITTMNVAKQTTADNKLSVEIEVSAIE